MIERIVVLHVHNYETNPTLITLICLCNFLRGITFMCFIQCLLYYVLF